jgi:L-histidine Nalpha-methyltransferase
MSNLADIAAETGANTDVATEDGFRCDVREGLSRTPKTLSSRFIYDDEGSRLFQSITELPEYYPTGCEAEILESGKERLGELFGSEPFCLAELGAGDGKKTRILLRHLVNNGARFTYVPVDISATALDVLVDAVAGDCPGLVTRGLAAEYFHGLSLLSACDDRRKVVLFLGSNIGNMDPDQADRFLCGLWDSLNHGDHVLLGFDLKKDAATLSRAYNDSAGVTARFNKNLLVRINRELGGEFDLESFSFYSTYVPERGAVMSYLISSREQNVAIRELGMSVHFDAWEPIHTESSHKYSENEIHSMAERNGFTVEQNFGDHRGYFVDSLWRKTTP